MVQDTNLTFSDEEMSAMRNSRFFEVKQEITVKVQELFGQLQNELTKEISSLSFPGIEFREGKIFRGENYRLAPYIILDCPRLFTTETIFAFRSMFWWGHEFSFTLHLQGEALEMSREKLVQRIGLLDKNEFYLCVNETPWEYTFETGNYVLLEELHNQKGTAFHEMIRSMKFVKLSRKLPLDEYANALKFGRETFTQVIQLLQ